jgi:hypothetical protein
VVTAWVAVNIQYILEEINFNKKAIFLKMAFLFLRLIRKVTFLQIPGVIETCVPNYIMIRLGFASNLK